jgi:hypothetical protein
VIGIWEGIKKENDNLIIRYSLIYIFLHLSFIGYVE